jgi:hypothetical protein
MPDVYKRLAHRFRFRGLDVRHAVDDLPDGKYPIANNVRSYVEGVIQPRAGQTALNTTAIPQAGGVDMAIRQIRRLNDETVVAGGVGARLIHAENATDGRLYFGNTATPMVVAEITSPVVLAGTLISRGFGRKPVAMVAWRPDQSARPWMYCADVSKAVKVQQDGSAYIRGIVQPNVAPTSALAAPLQKIIHEFDATAGWTAIAPAVAPVLRSGANGRFNSAAIVITAGPPAGVLYDNVPTNTGWALVRPSGVASNFSDLGPGARVIVNAGGGGVEETVTIQEVRPAAFTTTIGRIIYDSGTTGLCSIFLATTVSVTVNTMLLTGGTAEYVRVLSVNDGPDGLQSIRCSTVNNHAAAESITGVWSFRCYFANNPHVGGEALAADFIRSTFDGTVGTGHLTITGGVAVLDLGTTGARPLTDDDEIHISLRLSHGTPGVNALAQVTEGRVQFDVNADAAFNNFTRNYFFYAFRASDLNPAVAFTAPVVRAREQIITRGIIDSPPDPSGDYPDYSPNRYDTGTDTNPDAAYPTSGTSGTPEDAPVSGQLGTGELQWMELRFKVGQLTRVGTDSTRGLKDTAAIRVSLTVLASAVVLDLDSWWIGGTYGPDTSDTGLPYQYRYRGRSTVTGAKSNPSPPIRGGIAPRRQRVQVSCPRLLVATDDSYAQVDVLDVERFGGQHGVWRYVGTITNNTAAGADIVFNDDLSDIAISSNPSLGDAIDQGFGGQDQPFTVIGLPVQSSTNTCTVAGTSVTRTAGDLFSTGWAPGTVIFIDTGNGAQPYTLYRRPGSTSFLELNENAGSAAGARWYVPEPKITSQLLPTLWGDPSFMDGRQFAVGDQRNAGRLYYTNKEDPDGTAEDSWLDITSPSEALMNGCIYDGRCYCFSSDRYYLVLSKFDDPSKLAAQVVTGSQGLYARWGLAVGDRIYFVGKDGIYATNGGPPVSITDDDLYPLFPHDGVPGQNIYDADNVTVLYSPPNYTRVTHPAGGDHFRLTYYDDWLYFDYYDTDGTLRTLTYNTLTGAWSADNYPAANAPLMHYGEEGSGVRSLMMGAGNGKAYSATGTSDDGTTIVLQLRTPSDDGGDPRAVKQWGDMITDLDPANIAVNGITIQPGFDNHSVTVAATALPAAATTVRTQYGIDLGAGSGQLRRNISIFITASSTTATPKFYLWEPSALVRPENTLRRASDWDDGGHPGAKWVQGIVIEADSIDVAKSVLVQSDNGTNGAVQTEATLTVRHNGQSEIAYSWTPFRAHLLRLLGNDAIDWRLFRWKWIFEPEPELALNWVTQSVSHGLQGYQFMRDGYITLLSTTTVTLTITVDGTAFSYTIASTAGAVRKIYVPFQVMKGKSWAYSLTATAGLRVYKSACEVRVKQWGGNAPFQSVNPFGGLHAVDGAAI